MLGHRSRSVRPGGDGFAPRVCETPPGRATVSSPSSKRSKTLETHPKLRRPHSSTRPKTFETRPGLTLVRKPRSRSRRRARALRRQRSTPRGTTRSRPAGLGLALKGLGKRISYTGRTICERDLQKIWVVIPNTRKIEILGNLFTENLPVEGLEDRGRGLCRGPGFHDHREVTPRLLLPVSAARCVVREACLVVWWTETIAIGQFLQCTVEK